MNKFLQLFTKKSALKQLTPEQLKEKEEFDRLIRIVKEESGAKRYAAIELLGERGVYLKYDVNLQVDALLTALTDDYKTTEWNSDGDMSRDVLVSDVALWRLASLRSLAESAVIPLIEALKNCAGKPYNPDQIIHTLIAIGDKRAIEPILEYCIAEGKDVDKEIVKFGADIVKPLLNKLELEIKYNVRASIVEVLGLLHDRQAMEAILKALDDEASRVRREAIYALGKFKDPRSVDKLISVLEKEEDKFIRRELISSLKEIGDVRALVAFSKSIKDSDSVVRYETVKALRKMLNPQSVEILIEALLKDQEYDSRALAAEALGEIGDRKATEALRAVMKIDSDERVRYSAVAALGKLKDKQSVEPIIELLRDRKGKNRRVAVQSLGNIGDVRAVRHLIDAMEHPPRDTDYSEYEKDVSKALMAILKINRLNGILEPNIYRWEEWWKQNQKKY